jgi:hypothetical protein
MTAQMNRRRCLPGDDIRLVSHNGQQSFVTLYL